MGSTESHLFSRVLCTFSAGWLRQAEGRGVPRWEVKHMHGGGQRSPPRGGADPAAANQQLLVDSDSGASGDGGARSDASGAHPIMLVAG